MSLFLHSATVLVILLISIVPAAGQTTAGTPTNRNLTVQSIAPPLRPLPPEEMSTEVSQFSFFVYGDTRGRRDGKEIQYEHSLVVDSMIQTITNLAKTAYPVRFVLQTGDAVVNGRDPRQWNASFVSLINRLTREGGIPYYLAPGNHDVTSADQITSTNRQEGLRNYLAAVANLIPPDMGPRRLDGYPTFAFGYGNSFFIALDSNIAGDDAQYNWAVSQLEGLDRSRYRHVFAFFHHPPFSSGPHGGAKVEAPVIPLRDRYLPLFRKHHLSALFAGHEHLFEHWVERYEDKTGRKFRLDHVVTGGGGAPLYTYRGEPDLRDYLKTNEVDKVELTHLVKPGDEEGDNPYHYVVVRVDGGDLHLEVIGIDWGKNFQPYRSRATGLTD